MARLRIGEYNREKAVAYAHKWAFGRNPKFYNFENIGGDCTNFASQCLFAGTGVMNFKPTFGWYYISVNKRAPAWTSVVYFYDFLVNNQGIGPYGREVSIDEVEVGDFVQLMISKQEFQHTPIIVSVGETPTLDNILVAAHSIDADDRPLSSYNIYQLRFIHIEGFRKL